MKLKNLSTLSNNKLFKDYKIIKGYLSKKTKALEKPNQI